MFPGSHVPMYYPVICIPRLSCAYVLPGHLYSQALMRLCTTQSSVFPGSRAPMYYPVICSPRLLCAYVLPSHLYFATVLLYIPFLWVQFPAQLAVSVRCSRIVDSIMRYRCLLAWLLLNSDMKTCFINIQHCIMHARGLESNFLRYSTNAISTISLLPVCKHESWIVWKIFPSAVTWRNTR